MARCEDFPCCGHENGCCPDFDEHGSQMNMICVCGAKLPVNNPVSICNGCLNQGDDDSMWDGQWVNQDEEEEEYDDGQPTMYEEYQDLYGGDDFYEHTQFEDF